MPITKDELVDLKRNYDFINHSVKSFSEKHNVIQKTALKYLRLYNIKYNHYKEIQL